MAATRVKVVNVIDESNPNYVRLDKDQVDYRIFVSLGVGWPCPGALVSAMQTPREVLDHIGSSSCDPLSCPFIEISCPE